MAARAIKWAAGASFTLYLVHQPLLVMASAIFPVATNHARPGITACIAILLFILLLAELGERRKRHFTAAIKPVLTAAFPLG